MIHNTFIASFIILVGGSITASGQQAVTPPAPQTITFQDALALARKNSVDFHAALTDQALAREDKVQARAALLPSLTYNNQAIDTQARDKSEGRFISSNGVHEYVSQGNAHESIGLSDLADYRRAAALASVARLKAEIAARGLTVTVVQTYYGLIASQRKYASEQQAAAEAERFLEISQKLEKGGEVAHSDVIKATLQTQDRRRDLREAQLAMEKARLDLAVLLFQDFNENFTVVDDLDLAPPLVSFDDFERAARKNNLEVRMSGASLKAAQFAVASARFGYLPSLSLDTFYGIDAPQFATRSDGVSNLGYAAVATLNIPVWNWGATHSKVVQATLKRQQAERELSLAQRKLLASLRTAYSEADAARSELELLKSSSELAAESQRLTILRYQSGEASVLDVVDSQNTLTQARIGYHDGIVRYRVALANLQTLTGTM
ncbi:MAG TPA: TolC family protein [Alphaproteobacteria bacterium]|nr:TolC family protein [Alphaproteobacteria bacterium]